MKNLKIVTLSAIALTSLPELTYPIVFTGPVRRNAHRNQQKQAYQAGLTQGKEDQENNFNENSMNDNVDNVSTELNSSQDAAVDQALQDAGLDDDLAAALQENVNVQAVDPTPAQKTTASTEHANEQAPTLSMAIAPAPVTANEEQAQPTTAATSPAPSAEQSEKSVDQAPPAPSAEQQPQPSPIQTPVPAKVDEEQAQSMPSPTLTAAIPIPTASTPAPSVIEDTKKENMQKPEQVKIIKVYPVYEAIHGALQRVYAATQDMVNYVYNFVAKK